MSYYTIKNTNLRVAVVGDFLYLPAANGSLEVRLAADGLCHVMTDGLDAEQQDHNRISVEYLNEPLCGYGDHDGDTHWDIDGYWVADKTIRSLDRIFKKPVRFAMLRQAAIEVV